MKRYKCVVCGHIHEGDEPPELCPVCHVGKDMFELMEDENVASAEVKRWHCTICGFIHEGEVAPDICPVCGVGPELFELLETDASPEESTDFGKIVVVGGGIAGLSAVEAICRRTARAEVTLVTEEDEVPYYRLNLTRYLAGEVGRDALPIRDESWYTDKGVRLVKGKKLEKIDRYGRLLHFSSGYLLSYDRLVVATGATPIVPPIPGLSEDGVYTLRTTGDVDQVLARVKEGTKVVCIGGGILGLEIAGALNRQKADVTVLSITPTLMPRQLTPEAARVMEEKINELGITVVNEAETVAVSTVDNGLDVTLADGRCYNADLVLVAVGVRPSLETAKACGLECNRGIIVNDMMKTSDPDIFAAGDVSEQHGVLYGLWHPAMLQGAVAGSNATGGSETFDGVPPMTVIKVLGIGMFTAGVFNKSSDEQHRYCGMSGGAYYELLVENNRLIGANEVGDVRLSTTLSHLIENHVDMAQHLNDDTSLDSLLQAMETMDV